MRSGQLLRNAFAAITVLLVAGSTVWPQSEEPRVPSVVSSSPPVAPVRDVTDDYHGTKVVDPYRYMENLQDPEVQAWFKGKNDYTRAVLASLPGRPQLLTRIRELDQSVSRRSMPGDCRVIFTSL